MIPGRPNCLLLGLLIVGLSGGNARCEDAPRLSAQIDGIFSEYRGTRTPGLSIAVYQDGEIKYSQAYGMADLEHNVPNTTQTVFECGSVSKQFTAAATVLLSLDGKLSLDDDVRDHVPELPEFDEPITVRHLLNHTSGLRDWGSVARLAGWPRGSRTHNHDHVLRILARQKTLNHPTGHDYSYTNSGYNLLSIIVERVSGRSLNEFCSERIFTPLGMDRTQWRDNYKSVVKDRAIAYARQDGQWQMDMPYENVYGNGGLLTTAEDLVKFSVNLDTGELGGPRFVEEMHRAGILADGSTIEYASGLFLKEYRGIREVSHGGATAGYRAYLARYPDHDFVISAVSNAANFGRSKGVSRIVDILLKDALTPPPVDGEDSEDAAQELSEESIRRFSGLYRDQRNSELEVIRASKEGLKLRNKTFYPDGNGSFQESDGTTIKFVDPESPDQELTAKVKTPSGDQRLLDRTRPFDEPDDGLVAYTGSFRSDEASATYQVALSDDELVLRVNLQEFELRPVFKDGFLCRIGGMIEFHRDEEGKINALSCHASRVWDLRFRKLSGSN